SAADRLRGKPAQRTAPRRAPRAGTPLRHRAGRTLSRRARGAPLPGGWLADRFGGRRLLGVGTLGWTLSWCGRAGRAGSRSARLRLDRELDAHAHAAPDLHRDREGAELLDRLREPEAAELDVEALLGEQALDVHVGDRAEEAALLARARPHQELHPREPARRRPG